MIADDLAEYAHNLKYSDLSKDTIHAVKRHFIDAWACAIAAKDSPPVKIIEQIENVTLPMKAFLYGTAVRYLDYDDWYGAKTGENSHPNDNFGATWAVSEAINASGKDFILASALAYEIQCQLCDAASLQKKGWDHVIYGAASATLAAGKLLGLSKEELAQAVNIALHTNISSRQVREAAAVSMWKACAFSNVVRNDIFACLLAKKGMKGPNEVFEGKYGLMNQVTGEFKLDVNKFGKNKKKFLVEDCWFKKWPAEIRSQSAIQAALEIRKQINVKDIATIEIETESTGYRIIGSGKEKWNPKTRETADHSLPYIVVAALIDGKINEDSFSSNKFMNKKHLSLLKKTTVEENESLNKLAPFALPSIVRVKLASGKIIEKKIIHHRGHNKNQMDDSEIEEKYNRLTKKYLSEQKRKKILIELWNLNNKVNWKLLALS
jgi:2-methylcitrate dehydratase